ncbi:MAG: GNAT family N-acetyltransferase [Tannerellaceae bacterium]|jgi:hypothetical protein|nr:GNAT family N-acetyltransferase [Tannerellaceae bacterium]
MQSTKEAYRILCDSNPTVPLFSQYWWLDKACGAGRWDVFILFGKGYIRAAFPFYRPASGIISMPAFTQTMGPWFAGETEDTKYSTKIAKRQAACKEFIDLLNPYSSFLQNFHHSITDWLPFYWANFNQTTRYTYILNDISNPDKILAAMSANIRRNIDKARGKHRIQVRRGIPPAELTRMVALSFERQGLKPKHLHLLPNLISEARSRNKGDIWGAYDNRNQLHAAAFVAWHGPTAYYIAGGSDPELRGSGAHSLTLWQAILDVRDFAQEFDFEGSMLSGVERFFREFGAEQRPYFTICRGRTSIVKRIWIKLGQLWTR